ncbi:hypothetical protein LNP74_08695 [Klebsiella pneumoniae subsp. pneumoniae]|nr:hypothetical protein [Klebsiella pneumoniae subsp. pneumoniae]
MKRGVGHAGATVIPANTATMSRRGGGRRQRFFGHGELRLIIPGYPQPQRQPWL